MIEVRYFPESPTVFKEVSKENTSGDDKSAGRFFIFAGFGMMDLRYLWERI